MVNVLDTHRILYRNAVLRAYDAANPTTRINFFDSDTNIGTEVYTNENGYLFYESNGRQPIECLSVDGDAIIKVSLDGGNNFDITWQITDNTAESAELADIHSMTYRGSDGARATWNITQADCDLPDYLLKSEYNTGIWGEQELAVADGIITPGLWTHVITILSEAPANIVVDTMRLRAGQMITIRSRRSCTLNIRTGSGPYEEFAVSADHTYLLINRYSAEQTTAGLTLIDITPHTDAEIKTLAKAAVPVRTQKNIFIRQTESNQQFDLTSEFTNGIAESPVYIFHSSDSNYGDMSIMLPSASFYGTAEIVLDLNYDDITVGPTVNVQAYNSNIINITVPSSPGQYVYHLKLIAWQNRFSNRRHKLILET